MEYPTDIVTESGWERIYPGHDIAVEVLERDLLGQGQEKPRADGRIVVDEVWMRFIPRVKWCSRVVGFGCDQEGDWHQHWEGTCQEAGDPFTIARWDSSAALSSSSPH